MIENIVHFLNKFILIFLISGKSKFVISYTFAPTLKTSYLVVAFEVYLH